MAQASGCDLKPWEIDGSDQSLRPAEFDLIVRHTRALERQAR